jgi:hypothetical protein
VLDESLDMKNLRRMISHKKWLVGRKIQNIRFYKVPPVRALQHLLFDVEYDNFTYDISNCDELSQFLSRATGINESELAGYIAEILNDEALHTEISGRFKRPARFGRRVGWYALIRATRPAVVVEAGVHDGLGACAILSALAKNDHGKLIGMDIQPEPGSAWLIPPHLRTRFEFVAGDIVETLPALCERERIDLFIHDSDHSEIFEAMEYEVITPHLPQGAIVISDCAAPVGNIPPCVLEVWAQQQNRHFDSWQEKPIGHFYFGAHFGISLDKSQTESSGNAGIHRNVTQP